MIKLTDVHKSYGRRAVAGANDLRQVVLRGVSLEIQKGETVSIVGPSGTGKSTFLHLIGLLDSADNGTIEIDGQPTTRLSEADRCAMRNKDIGFVFQAGHLVPELSSLENVALPLLLAGANRKTALERARTTIESTLNADEGPFVERMLKARPSELSGGQCQRIALARALVGRPRILLADEPTGSLDEATAQSVVDLLLRLNESNGCTLVIVTHHHETAARTGRSYVMRHGDLHPAELAPGQPLHA